jgi:hypothetical protein
MPRLDTAGSDVTHLPGLWDESDTFTEDLQMTRTQAKVARPRNKPGASTKRATVAPRERKRPTGPDRRTAQGRFALHLDALLIERGMDTTALAKASSIAEPTIRKWLRGESIPPVTSLPAIAKALGMADYRQVLPPTL